MKYEEFVCAPIIIIITSLKLLGAHQEVNGGVDHGSFSTERLFPGWNETWDGEILSSGRGNDEISTVGHDSAEGWKNFPAEVSKCINAHQYQITESFSSGKEIILHCFKATLIVSFLKYFVVSPKSSVKLFNGAVELKKIQTCRDKSESCNGKRSRLFEKFGDAIGKTNKKNFYVKMYKKAVEKMMNENNSNARRNLTEEEKTKQLNRIEANSQAFLSEILKSLEDEQAEKAEEENIKRELSDPKLLSLFNILTKNYMLKLNIYQGISARMKRSHNGGVTFDLEISDPNEEEDEQEAEEGDNESDDQSSTREIRESDGVDLKDYFDEESGEGTFSKKGKGNKKKKEVKKKAKKLKKYLPYLILPMLIQMALLPFVFKKLFLLAIKALLAGKVALILIGFNLLRNSCVSNEESIRVEHYGFKGEEYGAWVNGRSIQEPRMVEALSEEPYLRRKEVNSTLI